MTKKKKEVKLNQKSIEIDERIKNLIKNSKMDYEKILLDFFTELNTFLPFKYLFFTITAPSYSDGDINAAYIDTQIMLFDHNTYSNEGFCFDMFYDANQDSEICPDYSDRSSIIDHLNKVFSYAYADFHKLDAIIDEEFLNNRNEDKITFTNDMFNALNKYLLSLLTNIKSEEALFIIKNIDGEITLKIYNQNCYNND
jgi:hypothetical protein